jgi:CheY-like chemotaxis protein
VPEEVLGDPLRVRQILSNLLSNAVKFTSHGFIVVRLRSTAGESGALSLHIDVEDTGPGIPPEKLSYIFDKFTQADGSVSRKYGGTGLGLAITKKLAEMSEGGITVKSELDRGTTFSVNLKCGTSIVSDVPRRNPLESVTRAPHAGVARILVVEDNQVNQKVVTAVLRKRGFAIELANDGREAVAKLENGDYDLILMDVQMPVLDGLEATRIIRRNQRWKSLPIIAMTAHAMNGDRERCLDAGMTGYVSKPVHPSHLLQVIDEHLVGGCGVERSSASFHQSALRG